MRRIALAALAGFLVAPHAAFAQMRPRAVTTRDTRPLVRMSVNGIHQSATESFAHAITTPLFVPDPEPSTIATTYDVPEKGGFDAGVAVRVWRALTLGGTVTRIRSDADAPITIRVPYPFLFDQHREATGTAPGLERDELALHGQVGVLLPVTPRLHVLAAAGPTFVRVRQDIVSNASISYEYPYDAAVFRSSVASSQEDSALGFNAGVDVSFMFTRTVGAGGILRYSRTTIDSDAVEGLSYGAGGLHVGAGIRINLRM
jgi:hypothetical protein